MLHLVVLAYYYHDYENSLEVEFNRYFIYFLRHNNFYTFKEGQLLLLCVYSHSYLVKLYLMLLYSLIKLVV